MTNEEAINYLKSSGMSEEQIKDIISAFTCEDAISRQAVLEIQAKYAEHMAATKFWQMRDDIKALPPITPQPKTGHWNNHQIACMLADLFSDACACNYNGIDEWLSELCDFKDTCCPNPVGVACWEQFLKHSQSRYTESEG